MIRFIRDDSSSISRLLTPSWLSGLLAVFVAFLLTAGFVAAFSFESSRVQQQLESWQQTQPQRALTTPDQTLPENGRPTLQESWPLIVLWAVVGLVIYGVAATIVDSLKRAAELRESMEYVNARPEAMLKDTVEHLAMRIVAAVMLIFLLLIFFKTIIPYSITAAHASSVDVVSVDGLLYALTAFGVVLFSLHVLTIFLRLTSGKVRIRSTVN